MQMMRKWIPDLGVIWDLQPVKPFIQIQIRTRKTNSLISGQETLRLFVVVNSLVMFLTIAWPQMKAAFETLSDFITENFGSSELF